MLAPSAYLASAASTLLLQQSILPDSIWMQGDQSVASTATLWTGLANSKACEPHTCVCGKAVDARGLHGLSCRRNAPRQQRHSHLSDQASPDASSQRANQPDVG